MFNSFAKKKLCINIKSQVSWAWVGESRRSRKYGFPANQFRKGSMHSDCTDGLFDIGGLFHTEVIKPNIDLHMDMLPGNMKRPGDEEIC